MSKRSLIATFEAIDFQHQSLLAKELTLLIEQVIVQREKKVTELEMMGFFEKLTPTIEKVIFKYTGIKTSVECEVFPGSNAGIVLPTLDKNNPLYIEAMRYYLNDNDTFKAINKNNGQVIGGVDLENSKVSGYFSELTFKLFISTGMLLNNNFSAKEITAVLLHELGHGFSMLENISNVITTNVVLQSVSKGLLNTQDKSKKIKLINEAEKALKIQIEEPEALLTTTNKGVITTVIIRSVVLKQYNELQSKTYDMRSFEALADQFANRHGVGMELVTGLDKMYKNSGLNKEATGAKGVLGHTLLERLKLQILLLPEIIIFGIVSTLMELFIIDPTQDIYDTTKYRLTRIKQDLVNALKDKKLNASLRKQYVADIENMDKIIAEWEERRTLLQLFWTTVYPSTRKQWNQMKFQQELELMVNNDLFVKASKLQDLKA